jgi:hypothetical protein
MPVFIDEQPVSTPCPNGRAAKPNRAAAVPLNPIALGAKLDAENGPAFTRTKIIKKIIDLPLFFFIKLKLGLIMLDAVFVID